MALQKVISVTGKKIIMSDFGKTESGEEVISQDCYIKVVSVTVNKRETTAYVSFSGDGRQFGREYKFETVLGDANAIAQAYVHLKSLPEFSGAKDC